jgi:hypothetical protein
VLASSELFRLLEGVHGVFDLCTQVGTVESRLVNNLLASGTIPSQLVERRLGSRLLNNDSDCVGKANGVVGGVG